MGFLVGNHTLMCRRVTCPEDLEASHGKDMGPPDPEGHGLSKNLPYVPLQLASPDLYSLLKKKKKKPIIVSMVLS